MIWKSVFKAMTLEKKNKPNLIPSGAHIKYLPQLKAWARVSQLISIPK